MNIALVTGASAGIGESIARQLICDGFKVYGLSRSRPNILSENFVWIECDLSKSEQIKYKLNVIDEKKIDVLVSNAGVIFTEDPSGVTSEIYHRTFAVNTLAPMLVICALREKLNTATIITVSSISDRIAEAEVPMYCSSKAANTMYFNALAQEMKSAKVITLLPDYVDTPMQHRSNDANNSFDWSATIDSADIADLCSNVISDAIKVESGVNIVIVTEKLKADLLSVEKLYGYNTDSRKLIKL